MQEKTLHEGLQEYLEHLKAGDKSERTLYTYGRDIQQIESFFGPEKKLSAILIPHVAGFLKSDALLRLPNGKDRSEPTIRKTVRVLRMFLFWAREQGYIEKIPLPKDVPVGCSIKNEEVKTDANEHASDTVAD